MNPLGDRVKRGLDRALASIGLPAAAIPMAEVAVAVAVGITIGRPVLSLNSGPDATGEYSPW